MNYSIEQSWLYDRPACDCCEGFYFEEYRVYRDGEFMASAYGLEEAKACVLDDLLLSKPSSYSLELSLEDYPLGLTD